MRKFILICGVFAISSLLGAAALHAFGPSEPLIKRACQNQIVKNEIAYNNDTLYARGGGHGGGHGGHGGFHGGGHGGHGGHHGHWGHGRGIGGFYFGIDIGPSYWPYYGSYYYRGDYCEIIYLDPSYGYEIRLTPTQALDASYRQYYIRALRCPSGVYILD